MSRKPQAAKRKQTSITNHARVEEWLTRIDNQIHEGNIAEAIPNCQRLLHSLPSQGKQRMEALHLLSLAHFVARNHPEAYKAASEALALDPDNVGLLYNRGVMSRTTSRFGQFFHDLQRADELNTDKEFAKYIAKDLKLSRKLAEGSIKRRGRGFTLDQLIEQEDLMQQANDLIVSGDWAAAEQTIRRVIAMGDCLPQPWGNLAICMMMQERYDEAEAALKRALKIDPRYTIAKRNLKLLPETRRYGPPKMIATRDPFAAG